MGLKKDVPTKTRHASRNHTMFDVTAQKEERDAMQHDARIN
jgi:hypothetical protein